VIADLVEETNDLSSNVLSASLLVVHNASTGGQDDVAELTRGQQLDNPLLEIGQANVVSGRDNTGLVETAVQLDNNLARSVVIDLLEFTNVAVTLHDSQELGDNLGAGSDEDLALSGLLGIVDRLKSVVENRSLDHFGGSVEMEILKSLRRYEVSAKRIAG